MQIALPGVLPVAWLGSLGSLLRLDDPLLAYALSPVFFVGTLGLWLGLWAGAKKVAAASTRRVPRLVYGVAGLCFLGLAAVLGPMAYGESHANGNAAISVTLAFLAFYCVIAGVLGLGRALVRGPKRLVFWVFLPRWVQDAQLSERRVIAAQLREDAHE